MHSYVYYQAFTLVNKNTFFDYLLCVGGCIRIIINKIQSGSISYNEKNKSTLDIIFELNNYNLGDLVHCKSICVLNLIALINSK